MCGRYTLSCPDRDALVRELPFEEINDTRIQLRPRYNVAPGQRNPIVYFGERGLELGEALWGFARPSGGLTINARSETAARTALFRDAFRAGRCVVPADGFYEWRREGRVNQPYLFRRQDAGLFVMAGLREEGRYVILTQDAVGEVAEIHDRMPVLLDGDGAERWLSAGEIAEPPVLVKTAVAPRVNRIDQDDPACVEPVAQASFDFD